MSPVFWPWASLTNNCQQAASFSLLTTDANICLDECTNWKFGLHCEISSPGTTKLLPFRAGSMFLSVQAAVKRLIKGDWRTPVCSFFWFQGLSAHPSSTASQFGYRSVISCSRLLQGKPETVPTLSGHGPLHYQSGHIAAGHWVTCHNLWALLRESGPQTWPCPGSLGQSSGTSQLDGRGHKLASNLGLLSLGWENQLFCRPLAACRTRIIIWRSRRGPHPRHRVCVCV